MKVIRRSVFHAVVEGWFEFRVLQLRELTGVVSEPAISLYIYMYVYIAFPMIASECIVEC